MFLVIKCSKRLDIASSEFMFVAAPQWGATRYQVVVKRLSSLLELKINTTMQESK